MSPLSDRTLTRSCSSNNLEYDFIERSDPFPCPLSNTSGTSILPAALRELFSSGTEAAFSGPFDIRWRHNLRLQGLEIGKFRNIQSILLNERREIIEGLIVDTVKGGVGFRNHTVPIDLGLGAKWEEDVLFIEPETACVDTKIAFQWPSDQEHSLEEGYRSITTNLTDRGGLAELEKTRPQPDLRDPRRNADLEGRARSAAWAHNSMYASIFNLTNRALRNSSLNSQGRVFEMVEEVTSLDSFFSFSNFSFNDLAKIKDWNAPKLDRIDLAQVDKYAYSISDTCRGMDESSEATPRSIFVQCGIMRSMPIEVDRGLRRTSLYACASAVKAVIKTVSFIYNGTGPYLEGLKITDIQDKQYPDEASLPLWAVEDTGSIFNMSQISPLWGIISPKYATWPNITTYRQRSLYLPGRMGRSFYDQRIVDEFDNLAGFNFAARILRSSYCTGSTANQDMEAAQTGRRFSGACAHQFNYRPWASAALSDKWQRLTASAETASSIPNLIFTDLAANAVAGAKGLGMFGVERERLVTPYRVAARFNLAYIAPAAAAITATLLILLTALLHSARKGNGLASMKRHIQRLAPGRILVTLLEPAAAGKGNGLEMNGKIWSKKFGTTRVDMSKSYRLIVGRDNNSESPPDYE
ncbi:hypothetical protein CDD83_9534 [Cordyceps sp. RAO-2017]|nr:hypothetical protein CDD83_9534 [Cordyceps sp. RAO-2017]